MTAAAVRTTCPYCGVGCGILAGRATDGAVTIEGDTEHPANSGRLCSKGAALGETLSLDDRLLHPLVDGERAGWDAALDLVASRFSGAIEQYGPDSVAFYVSGQLLTEDYYVANKLMKGYIGSANIDTNSRLCMASSVAGHRRAFGSDTVPGAYEDLELADLVVLVGSNLAWCHPVLYQRLLAARDKRGTRIVVIDPRRTSTCEHADLHLPLASGTDVALFNGLLAHLDGASLDHGYIEAHTNGLQPALDAARKVTPLEAARITGLDRRDIAAFYKLFETTPRTVTVYSQGVNQSSAGTDKVNAIINCHLATGRIGKPGMGPFSVTGQPNAMGGREVGGLANMLAAHMDLDNAGHRRIVQEFWGSPRVADKPGLKAVDLFRAVGDGRIKALWIMGTNPADSMPEADTVRAALEACPFVAVSDIIRHTDTTAYAHVLLPSAAWSEKEGTVTNSERRISRQRAFLPSPGEARPDWWQLAEVGKRMGFAQAFAYDGPSGVFAEHARLSAAGNNGTRDFDIGAYGSLNQAQYEGLAPFQWPAPAAGTVRQQRFFAQGGFFTPDRRARFAPTPYRPPATTTTTDYPLILNTGRMRDQWHTMTRTGKSPRLMAQFGEPHAEINPRDAAAYAIGPAGLATVSTEHGSVVVRALITDRQPQGAVFLPMHWTAQLSSLARAGSLVGGALDPVSGQPELKHTPATIAPFAADWYGYAVGRHRPARPVADYWALARTRNGWRTELAGAKQPDDWQAVLQALAGGGFDQPPDVVTFTDAGSRRQRLALFNGNQLIAALFTSPEPVQAARDYLAGALDQAFETPQQRYGLLAARPPVGQPDPGACLCACLGVGRNQILAAIGRNRRADAEAIGRETGAGTGCGSCRAEIAALVEANLQAGA